MSISSFVLYRAKGGTYYAGDTEAVHYGLGAVVTGADGDAETVEKRVPMSRWWMFLYEEGHYGVLAASGAEEAHIRNLCHAVHAVFGKLMFVTGDVVHAESCYVVERHGESVRLPRSPACQPQT